MMSYFTLFACSAFSIALPSLAALLLFRKLPSRFLPIFTLFWMGLINEIISYLLIINGKNNGLNSNLYSLLECLLLLLIFYKQNGENRRYWIYAALICSIIFVICMFRQHSLYLYNPLTRFLFSFLILSISLNRIIGLLAQLPLKLQDKIDLSFSICFFTYFTYQSFILIFDIFPLKVSVEFNMRLYLVLSSINFVTNVIFTILILWIPRQMTYSRSS